MSSNFADCPKCVLFVPGDRPDMLAKAARYDAHGYMLDLEGAVTASEKERARQCVRAAIEGLAKSGRMVMPRVNRLDSGLIEADVAAVVTPHVNAIAVSQVNEPGDVRRVDEMIGKAERSAAIQAGTVGVMVFIESARGAVKAFEIAGASSRVVGLAFGAEDYCLDMGISRRGGANESAGGDQLYEAGVQHARATVALAARAAGCWALDTPYVRFDDTEGLANDAQLARFLGFGGKLAIHPAQIEIIDDAFSPSAQEVAHARQIVEAANAATREGRGVVNLAGQMIDAPIVERARRVLGEANR